MLVFNIITLFPELFNENLDILPFSRALKNKNISISFHNHRDFAKDNYKTVDDKPYGGGTGMILMIEPIYKILQKIHGSNFLEKKRDNPKIILLSPKGDQYNQKMAMDYSKLDAITIIWSWL